MTAGKSLPWLPWFHRDFLAATQGWTLIERAVYFLLLGASWELGALPNDQQRLASITGITIAEMQSVWEIVGRKFELTDAGLINRRLEQHRETQLDKCEKARESALKRWNRNTNGDANASANGHASALRMDMHPEPEPEPEPKADSEASSGVLEDSDSRPRRARTRERPTYERQEFHDQVIATYHENAPDLPTVKAWSKPRASALNSRIRECLKRGKRADKVDYWRTLFANVAASDFLCGRAGEFRADLEWILRPENFLKVIEGRYANRPGRSRNGEGSWRAAS